MLNQDKINAILKVLEKDHLTNSELDYLESEYPNFVKNPDIYSKAYTIDGIIFSLSEFNKNSLMNNDTDTNDSRLQTEFIDTLRDIVSVIHDLSCLWTEDRISKYGTEWKNIRYLLTNVLESYYNWNSDSTILADIMDIQTGKVYEIKRSVNIMQLRNLAQDGVIAVPYVRD